MSVLGLEGDRDGERDGRRGLARGAAQAGRSGSRASFLGLAACAALGFGAGPALAQTLTWSNVQIGIGSCDAYGGPGSQGCAPGTGNKAVFDRILNKVAGGTTFGDALTSRGSAHAETVSGVPIHTSPFHEAPLYSLPEMKAVVSGRPDFDEAYSWNVAFAQGVAAYRWSDTDLVSPVAPFNGMLHFTSSGGYRGLALGSMALLYNDVERPEVAALWAKRDAYGQFTADCNTPGAGAIWSTGVVPHRGDVVAYSQQQCGDSFTFEHGETYYLAVRLIVFIAGNGVVDADNTFTVDFAPDLSPEFRERIATMSTPVTGSFQVPGIPEPSTWAMLITGFAGAGAMLRRRRTSRVDEAPASTWR